MITYGDEEGKARVEAECMKRNKHVLKTHTCRWKALFDHTKGWHPAFRPNHGEKSNGRVEKNRA